jgi:hypothetical protein
MISALGAVILLMTLLGAVSNVYAATLYPATIVQGSSMPVTVTGIANVPTLVLVEVRACNMSILYTAQIGPVIGSYSVVIPTTGLDNGTYSVMVQAGSSTISMLSFAVIQTG